MTLIAIWLENETLWAASDTQVSTPTPAGFKIAEVGSKLFSLSIRWGVPAPDQDGDGTIIDFKSSSIGFAFAGRVFPALMVLSFANTCLLNLMAVRVAAPNLSDCAELVRKIGEQFLQDSVEKYGAPGEFCIALFGRCPETETLRAFKLVPKRDKVGSLKMGLSECNLAAHEMIVLGSHAAYRQFFKDRISEIQSTATVEPYVPTLAPQVALKEIIEKQSVPDVGGAVQLCFVVHDEFNLTAVTSLSEDGEGRIDRSFLGINIDRLEPVGKFSISIPLR
jgi:hypothetical protein